MGDLDSSVKYVYSRLGISLDIMSVLRAVMMVLALVAVETSEMRLKRQVFQGKSLY